MNSSSLIDIAGFSSISRLLLIASSMPSSSSPIKGDGSEAISFSANLPGQSLRD
ncbi:MAG: hypothetical protein ABIV21_06985 [Pyrinomonadaceae bacterium]